MSYYIYTGDCIEVMRRAGRDEGVDAIVTDPPYGLGFMGKKWDDLPPGEEWARECLRVLKPGGHLLAFGGTRTYHRLACALEDAGFEIRDCLTWLYGQGFPKSLDVSKAIDKAAGAEREVVGRKTGRAATPIKDIRGGAYNDDRENSYDASAITAPATPEAEQWQGWGTALKPAHEPIVLARKPLSGTVAANVLEHGTGAINVNGCRIPGQPRATGTVNPHAESGVHGIYGHDPRTDRQQRYDENLPDGRWPANVLLDEEAAALLDEQTGTLRARGNVTPTKRESYDASSYEIVGSDGPVDPGDSGGASRFFYVAKTSKRERNEGLDGFEEKDARTLDGGYIVSEGRMTDKRGGPRQNHHPTVKPIELMRWLVRLVTPPGGKVLDPFVGSGSTGIACVLEGFDFVGIDNEPEYVEIAKARIEHWLAKGDAP